MITMDWMPTLLAVGGMQPDPTYPSDGENLSPALAGMLPERSAAGDVHQLG